MPHDVIWLVFAGHETSKPLEVKNLVEISRHNRLCSYLFTLEV